MGTRARLDLAVGSIMIGRQDGQEWPSSNEYLERQKLYSALLLEEPETDAAPLGNTNLLER